MKLKTPELSDVLIFLYQETYLFEEKEKLE